MPGKASLDPAELSPAGLFPYRRAGLSSRAEVLST
ncbi:hypothetical protein B14911_08507 [Bacillus sp. NRRL B-14911]|nr:hypothetical protein B14911_08507 [Bacillus sp. NRRL B-14911]